jgi:hypothetical protein
MTVHAPARALVVGPALSGNDEDNAGSTPAKSAKHEAHHR